MTLPQEPFYVWYWSRVEPPRDPVLQAQAREMEQRMLERSANLRLLGTGLSVTLAKGATDGA